jgi:hypothetical protein
MLGTYERLGVSIWSRDIAVIRAARRKIKRKARRDRALRDARHAFYKVMLKHHYKARELATYWRL